MSNIKVECQAGCGWNGQYDDATPIKKPSERNHFGELYTDIGCPNCGSVCLPKEAKDIYPYKKFYCLGDRMWALTILDSNGTFFKIAKTQEDVINIALENVDLPPTLREKAKKELYQDLISLADINNRKEYKIIIGEIDI